MCKFNYFDKMNYKINNFRCKFIKLEHDTDFSNICKAIL